MSWGTVTLAGMELRETFTAGEDPSGLRIAGQEAHPPKTLVHVESVHLNLAGLVAAAKESPSLFIPVVFSDKSALTGFYRVTDARSDLTRIHEGSHQKVDWQATLERIGNARDVEIESRVPLIPRTDALTGTQTPVYWHAPAIGATSYLTGTGSPAGFVDRPGADGIIRVHTGLPISAPRWTVAAADYLRGGARLYVDTVRRLGRLSIPAAVWEMHNNLVRVTPAGDGNIAVSCWDNGGWRSPHVFGFFANDFLTTTPELTILRNEPEDVTVRLTYPDVSAGRLTVDLGLRRGSRFLTGVIKRHAVAGWMAVDTKDADPVTAVVGGLRQTTADADGNRYVLGSSRNVTVDVPGTGIGLTAARLDFFVGHEVGDPPAAGDAYADLLSQYLGSSGERVRVVRR